MNANKLRLLHQTSFCLYKNFQRRAFSDISAIGKPMAIPTEYLVSAARVCLRMPTHGDTWFFVSPTTTVT
jgi:hypothetical protein